MITSKEIKNPIPQFSVIYTIEREGEQKSINDERIINEEMAVLRATSEFLENGYECEEVEFTSYFSDIKINDVIKIYAPSYNIPKKLNKNLFIVKKVTHKFNKNKATTTLKGIRYD